MSPRHAIDAESGERRLRQMLRIRRFEERCVELYSAEEIRGFLHLAIGEEAIPVGVMEHLTPDDAVVGTYREHGHALVRGVSMRSLMAEMMGRVEGCSRGRGGSMHLFDASTRFYGGNAIVGGGLPIAIGLALADRMQERPNVTACFFGEGAMAEGEFHEAMNLAALWDLPVLFCCENNRYAMGTALDRSEAATDLAARAGGYGATAWSVDGMDVGAVSDAAQRAIVAIRGGGGPVFLELRTYRFRAHSMYDPERYRSKDEVERWRERDPIALLSAALTEANVFDDDLDDRVAAIETEIAAEIDDAVEFGRNAAIEPVEDLLRFVVSETAVPAEVPG